MATRRTFEKSFSGIGLMLNSDFIQDAMHNHAEKVKAYAISISPTSNRARSDGDSSYRNSFVIYRIRVLASSAIRAGARLYNESGHAAAVEFGNRRNNFKGQKILSKAAFRRYS